MDHDSNLPSIAEEFVEAMDEVTDTRVQLQEISDLFLFRIEIDPSTDAARRIEKVLGAALPTTRGQVTGDATALHIGNAFCVLGALILGGWYGGLAGAVGMTIADLMDPVYITGAPKTFVLKLCIGLIVGLVAHRIAKINESTDRKYVLRWSVIASVAGLGFNVIADPIVGYFYKMYILGQPQEMAEVLAKWSTASTFVNAVVSTILVGVLYNALRPVLLKSGLIRTVKAKTA